MPPNHLNLGHHLITIPFPLRSLPAVDSAQPKDLLSGPTNPRTTKLFPDSVLPPQPIFFHASLLSSPLHPQHTACCLSQLTCHLHREDFLLFTQELLVTLCLSILWFSYLNSTNSLSPYCVPGADPEDAAVNTIALMRCAIQCGKTEHKQRNKIQSIFSQMMIQRRKNVCQMMKWRGKNQL